MRHRGLGQQPPVRPCRGAWGRAGGGLLVKAGPGKFAPGAFDHHNVQLLLSTVALFLAVVPSAGRIGPAGMGALSALATALSLAVGLEMVPMLFLLWGLAALRFAGARTAAPHG